MEYADGFYIYTPDSDTESLDELTVQSQVIEIIDNKIWVTCTSASFDINYAEIVGTIGRMVMDDRGIAL